MPRSLGEYLLPHRRTASLKADSIYRTHEARWARVALECLLASYGRETQPDTRYECVERSCSAVVGPDRRIKAVTTENLARSRIEGLDRLRVYVNIHNNPIDKMTVVPLCGLDEPEVVVDSPGRYRIDFFLRDPLALGEERRWGFVRRYDYGDKPVGTATDRLFVVTKNAGFKADVAVRFDSDPPAVCWTHDGSLLDRRVVPSEDRVVVPDATRRICMTTGTTTRARWAYGLAWRWED